MPFIRAEKRGFRIEGYQFIGKGQTCKVSAQYVDSIKDLIESGHFTVHPEDPNRRKPTPKVDPKPVADPPPKHKRKKKPASEG
jgi:alkanesulfonate monooxygenase SsuD/methylene tetrahydromethanopterin reductase-like flavin-dependent oxidoreductase (luciferase family)